MLGVARLGAPTGVVANSKLRQDANLLAGFVNVARRVSELTGFVKLVNVMR